MAKAKNPATFSSSYHIDPDDLDRLGVLDPTLGIDTKLFIDPLLFPACRQPEIHTGAVKQYRAHFERVIKLLAAASRPGDVAWRAARRLLEFPEIRGTCLGYGAASIAGSGFGRQLSDRVMHVGKEIVDLGVHDPDLFPAMALFEAGIGPDRVSDMATNVAFDALAEFNRRVLRRLGLQSEEFIIRGRKRGYFAPNPITNRHTPVILVPKDILRKLPIAHDWDSVASAASHNQALRDSINEHIAEIWAAKTKRDKARLKAQVMRSRTAFDALLAAVHAVPTRPYDVDGDPEGLATRWARLAPGVVGNHPLALQRSIADVDAVHEVVRKIVKHFRHLVEDCGLNRELYHQTKRRGELSVQRLFFAIAHAYCKANNVDLSPEIDTGNGKIDFKFSRGFRARVLVEVKLSSNHRLLSGFTTQLEVYKTAQETIRAIYLVIDVGEMGSRDEQLVAARNAAASRGDPVSDLEFVDGIVKPTASKR